MRIRWGPVDEICRETGVLSDGAVACWVELRDGKIVAGQRPAAPSATTRRPLWFIPDDVVTACVAGPDHGHWAEVLSASIRRALDHQATVRDMADATAKLWRHTNALLRMVASSNLKEEAGRVVASILGVVARSTRFADGVGLIRLPAQSDYTVYRDGRSRKLSAAAVTALSVVDAGVSIIGPQDFEGELRRACRSAVESEGDVAVLRLTTENEDYGFVVVSIEEGAAVTSEDIKLLAAAGQILSVAIENGYTLSKEKEAARLEVENELLATQARDMEEMVHVVAHDLRSPMTSMYGLMHVAIDAVDELREDLDREGRPAAVLSTDRIRGPLQDGTRSIEKLNRMVQRLLDFSRAARSAYSFEILDMDSLVDGVVRSLSYQIKRKGIDLDTTGLAKAVGDRVQLEAVFGNLIDNAIKYMGDPAHPAIAVGCKLQGKDTVYYVRDNGVGMTPDEVLKSFMPFRRFHSGAVPGEGIGLPYVRKIIERHGGTIWCKSEKDKGSTFYFTLGTKAPERDDHTLGTRRTRARGAG